MSSRLPARILTISRAAPRMLAFGRRSPPVTPARILVAHHLLLGDTLMLTPLLSKLRSRHPRSHIVMTAPKAIAPLYARRPYGVDVAPYDPRDAHTVRALMRDPGFDLALVPGDNRHSWLARALGARWIIAFSGDRPGYKSWPIDSLVRYPDEPGAWGDMVAELIDGAAPAPYEPSQWPAPPCAPYGAPRQPYSVLHVGASSPLKLWGNDQWRSLAEDLTARGYSVVWSAGHGEERLVAAIDPSCRYPSYAAKLDLAQLWRLIGNAALLVSPDTGIAHLGRLVHTPTVTLFGPGSAVICGAGQFWRNAPYRAVTVQNFPCRDQRILFRREIDWVRRCGRGLDQCPEPRCMQAISDDMVRSAVESMLSLTKSAADRQADHESRSKPDASL